MEEWASWRRLLRGGTILPFTNQAFGQGGQFCAGICAPDDATVRQDAHNRPVHGAAQGLDAVAGLEVGGLRKLIHDLRHGVVVEHAGDAMGHRRHHFAPAGGGEVRKDEVNDGSPHVGERVAVEKEEGGAAMTLPQELYGFVEGGDFRLPAPLLCFKRCIALWILAVLRASSCARSSVEADDKLPTPVFEKSGSGL
jgi:hypothetical protein